MKRSTIFLFLIALITGCGSAGDITDLTDIVVDPPTRKEIDRSKVGVQNFFTNQDSFGSVAAQYQDIRGNLGIRFVRVLVPWIDALHGSPNSSYNFDQSDAILRSIPPGVDVLVTLAHTPSWFTDSSRWVNGNPRQAWVDRFLRPVVEHYANTPGIIGWEVFNEPDAVTIGSDGVLGLTNPQNYLELLRLSHAAIKSIDPNKLVVMAATRSIQQDWPLSFQYNEALRDGGALNFTDVWNIHYYGKQYEKVVVRDGVADFLNGLGKIVWVTESGIQGANNQLAYAQEVWPFLTDKIPAVQRIYYYTYSSTGAAASSFGMRNTDPVFPVSDLYVHLSNPD